MTSFIPGLDCALGLVLGLGIGAYSAPHGLRDCLDGTFHLTKKKAKEAKTKAAPHLAKVPYIEHVNQGITNLQDKAAQYIKKSEDTRQDLAKDVGSESSMPALDLAKFSSLTSSGADTVEAADLEDYCDALAEELGCTETQSSVSRELRRNIQEQQTTGVYNEVKIMETQSNAENHSVSITCLKAQWSADGKEVRVVHVQQGVSWTPSAPSGAQLAINDEENMQRVLTQLKVQALTNLEARVQTSTPRIGAISG